MLRIEESSYCFGVASISLNVYAKWSNFFSITTTLPHYVRRLYVKWCTVHFSSVRQRLDGGSCANPGDRNLHSIVIAGTVFFQDIFLTKDFFVVFLEVLLFYRLVIILHCGHAIS